MKAKLLIVDDEVDILFSLREYLSDYPDLEIDTCNNALEALEKIQEINFDIVITDLKMPELDGISLLKQIKKYSPLTQVIILTAYASLDSAIQALREGAFDYLTKPLHNLDEVYIRIKRIVEHKHILDDNIFLRKQIEEQYSFDNIIGQSPKMQEVFRLIKKVAGTKGNVLITGQSGTGKELVAKAIHYNSPRKDKRFVAINCGAIVGNLMESELFGHKKGSFTGAIRDKDGLFKIADGGTLFLDEVGEIPLNLQVKLLRAIEEAEILPVGATDPIKVDVRIIAATNRDLAEEVKKGNFREDLYYRLNVIEIKLPPLSERKEDIPLLVDHFIKKYSKELGRKISGVDNAVMKVLLNYEWRGGIRELENLIERAIILSDGPIITLADLPPALNEVEIKDEPMRLKEAIAQFERQHILKVLNKTSWDKEEASQLLGISLSSLYRKMEELGINVKMSKNG
jgi:two-component system response regulator PilR (NtrC family)